MKKVGGVAQVRVSLNEGLTILELAPDNTVTLARLRQIIKNNGFVSKEASVVGHGSPSADRKSFAISGTNEQLALASPPQQIGDEWRLTVAAPPKR